MSKRRTQQERTAATRRALLDAAVRSLIDHGYAGTTTAKVAELAGVSRGALLHHFPDRAAFMRAVLHHVLEQRHAEFLRAVASIPEGPSRREAVIDALWAGISTDESFLPWIEMVVASRADPELRIVVREAADETATVVEQTFGELFDTDTELAPLAPLFAFALMNGLSLRKMVFDDDRGDAILVVLKQLSVLIDLPVPLEALAALTRGR